MITGTWEKIAACGSMAMKENLQDNV